MQVNVGDGSPATFSNRMVHSPGSMSKSERNSKYWKFLETVQVAHEHGTNALEKQRKTRVGTVCSLCPAVIGRDASVDAQAVSAGLQ